ncbi:hypothetical protein R1sor_016796 [Riccia sorocarpa]|uniref:Uncharacterized protein n=1 Tax=Riccia sorocarpa TaxID=122646 RepID=A0ABD3HIT4_9MARC
MNQKKIAEEKRIKDLQRQKLDECIRAQEEEKKQKQLEERKAKELQRQKFEESRRSQEKLKMEKDRKIQEKERRKKEMTKKKLDEASKFREEEKLRKEFRRKLADEQEDQDEQRRMDEEIGRWRREENNRRLKEVKMKVPLDDQVKLDGQRQKVEEVIRMSSELVLKGSEGSKVGPDDSIDSDEGNYITIPLVRQGRETGDDTSKENEQDQQTFMERYQQEQEEESRREAQQARYKRYQEERQCRTLEDDLQKLMEKASALANLVDDAESVGTLDELDSQDSFEDRRETDDSHHDSSMRDKRAAYNQRKGVPLCADKYEGMTYLYNRLEEEKRKQLLNEKPKENRKSNKKRNMSLPKNCGLPYAKSLKNKPARGVLEPIPFLKFDGSPCFDFGRYIWLASTFDLKLSSSNLHAYLLSQGQYFAAINCTLHQSTSGVQAVLSVT